MIAGIDLQVVTNSVDNAFALMNSPLPGVTILGGKLYKKEHYLASSDALEQIKKLRFNTAFIGASKVRQDGIYTASQADAEIIETVVAHSNQVALIAEKYKFTNHNSSPYLSAPLSKIDVVITDTPIPTEFRNAFTERTQIIPVMRKDSYA